MENASVIAAPKVNAFICVLPQRVHPEALRELELQAGGSLLTSSYLRRRDSLRILAVLAARTLTDPPRAAEHRARLRAWVSDLGADSSPRAAVAA